MRLSEEVKQTTRLCTTNKAIFKTSRTPAIPGLTNKLAQSTDVPPTVERPLNGSYSPKRQGTYKKYVGDISKVAALRYLQLPSKPTESKSNPLLKQAVEKQRRVIQQREEEENEEIAQGNVEIVVGSVQSHIKLIMRLIKATYASLEEYKDDAGVLKEEIFEMRQKLIDENEDVLKEHNGELLNRYKELKKHTKIHKTDNDIKYKELLKLKKGNAKLQTMIDNEVKRLEELELFVSGATDGYESDHQAKGDNEEL